MAKCGCAGTTCGCNFIGQGGITITGTGTAQDPYRVALGAISAAGLLTVDDTTSVDLTLLGTGTGLDPYVLSADVKVGAEVTSVPTNGNTTVIGTNENIHIFNPEGTIATHTITLPSTTTSFLKEITFTTSAAITALAVNGAGGTTVAGAPTGLAVNQFFRMRLVGGVWRRVG